ALHIKVMHLDEMGDPKEKTLVFELMGKHSNIILIDDKDMILDSAKHIGPVMSSVRQVLPGRNYFLPNTQQKTDLSEVFLHLKDGKTEAAFSTELFADIPEGSSAAKALVGAFTGISPTVAQEVCSLSGIDSDLPMGSLSVSQKEDLGKSLAALIEKVLQGQFSPGIYERAEGTMEFCAIPLYSGGKLKASYQSISSLLIDFYQEKEKRGRIRQKSQDLRHIVQLALERDVKKYDLQLAQLKDTEKKDKYKLYGELLHIYGYGLEPKAKELTCEDYHTGKEIRIPLDPDLNAMENAARYFARYEKLGRTAAALNELTKEVHDQIEHLKSVSQALEVAETEEDLSQIREELVRTGYIRNRIKGKPGKAPAKAKPLRFKTEEGFELYVGKNNFQNEEVTFKLADSQDWWFHSKKYPGSHVILKTEGKEVPDHVFEMAGALAAYYSAGKDQDKVEIDYTLKKNVKKPGAGSPPGFVIYYTNYSMIARPGLEGLALLS
ncbi:MAG: NFACT family protein, partial [Lachnospiraceae bacterium]|nr:NFACT family protein [Lachnospiraceae bacterium]